ncbi:dTDP-4-dehydrorhamnose 3,5-epimerase [Pedobacter polaris]|uniref:dTDP-4-dehydrorhamnose 3,5-epimerase n=1 Tax=Pedobacter polaris TaxID=2571273 RepID=A0A4U1CSX8_9SPHI|nr:dTDP-4-dehydrorhamnose 3,5-epimerase [Pedobacter polaris]TKC12231.1 dTDP-4-dehydrorhamnose 3,5-epimerase [Pedobacter polaris]
MNIIETPLEGLLVIEPKIWEDSRGYFYESFSAREFAAADINAVFVQDNQSFSQKGTLRGLHAQAPPFAQGKLVRVIQGSALDVAVDIRKHSVTYGQYFSLELTGENHKQMWIPPGFLHGFITLQDDTIFTYKVTNYYDKNSEIGVMWNDPTININWTAHIAESDLLLSDKDLVLEAFSSFQSPF